MNMLSYLSRFGFAVVVPGLLAPLTIHAQVTPTTGTMYYTTFSGGENVHKVDYSFDGTTFALTNNTGLAATPGADGIVFTADHYLAVGGQGGSSYKVDPTGSTPFTTVSSGGTSAYHMMADPNGVIWSSGIPGTPAKYNSTLTVDGTAVPLHYGNLSAASVDTLTWAGSNPNSAFYTSSGSGGYGEFGTVNLSTGLVSPIYDNLAAAHGMTYDSYTKTLVLFGDSHITQIDPTTDAIVHDANIIGGSIWYPGTWDQGTADGKGHLFVANNDGNLLFMDLTNSKDVTAPDFQAIRYLASSLDDVAPLSGSGSQNASVPDSGPGVLLTGLVLAGLLAGGRFVGRRRRVLA